MKDIHEVTQAVCTRAEKSCTEDIGADRIATRSNTCYPQKAACDGGWRLVGL